MNDDLREARVSDAQLLELMNRHRYAVVNGELVPLEPAGHPEERAPGAKPARPNLTPDITSSLYEPDEALPPVRPRGGRPRGPGGNAALGMGMGMGMAMRRGKGMFSDASAGSAHLLFPAFAVREMHRLAEPADDRGDGIVWENFDIAPPPGPAETADEAAALLVKQERLATDELRKEAILRQANLDVTAFTRPLGIEGLGGFEATVGVFYTIISLCGYVVLLYKDRFSRPRPNQVDPRIRPFLPNPPHAAYPSGHATQAFAIADVFAEIAESEPATIELYRAAREVAENREHAGLHFASDTEAGRDLARKLTPYLVEALEEPLRRAQLEWQ